MGKRFSDLKEKSKRVQVTSQSGDFVNPEFTKKMKRTSQHFPFR